MSLSRRPSLIFGGKRTVAALVWRWLGNPDNYIEPFFGSGAVLLSRPGPPRVETANDADCMIANFWRATQRDPEAVAAFADGPVNEADLHARHRWLVLSDDAAAFRQRMRTDPDHFDPKVAGWWCWGLCCWIGSGWCSATPPEATPNSKLRLGGDNPGSYGKGVHAKGLRQKAPRAEQCQTGGVGVHGVGRVRGLREKRPRSPGGFGSLPAVHGNVRGGRPQLADAYDVGRGVHSEGRLGTCAERRAWLLDWFGRLRDRLRTVRVCCGDWSRVCSSESVTTRLGVTGVFLDPPYAKTRADGGENRADNLYANDAVQDVDGLVKNVRAWCLERGGEPRMRIALCGYEGEGHDGLEAAGWSAVAWQAAGGYGNRTDRGRANAGRERIWFSPHCLRDPGLFDELEAQEGGES